ncbi:MAG: DegT/DnrJ/EryC1/StrS family aminotransferase, partial [Sphaerochaetaceae bacterium]|nr:DegT/DnrJ/EryC1/StrS family aminotransferase [Sphaerochaetaceae bacterium]
GLPLGAMKGRINQTCSAMGRVQLRYFQQRIEEIQAAMNYFWDQMVDVPGIRPHRISPSTNYTMGAWYYPQALFNSEELNNIECSKFAEAIRAEGISWCFPGGNEPLHLHPFFHTADIFNTGKPTSISFGQRDVRQGVGTLKNSENIKKYSLAIPWFKHFEKKQIDAYIHAFKKVIENITLLES